MPHETNTATQYIRTKLMHIERVVNEEREATAIIHEIIRRGEHALQNFKKDMVRKSYQVKDLKVDPSKIFCFLLIFEKDFSNGILPTVKLNGQPITTEKVSGNTIRCYLGKNIDSKNELCVLKTEGSSVEFDNPYYFSEIKNCAIWQNKGHTKEKNIYLLPGTFPNTEDSIVYCFDLMINNAFCGSFLGFYKKGLIIIEIPKIDPKFCENKKCVLRFNFDKRQSILLPKPITVSTNHVWDFSKAPELSCLKKD